MDAASLALSIAVLYTTCRDCYDFFTAVKAAETESSAHLRELEIQQSILKAWGFHWQIQSSDGSQLEHSDRTKQKRTKLHQYLLSNRFKAEGVFKTLSALADTLSNQEKLTKRYGIQFQSSQAIQDGLQSTNNVQLTIPNTTIEDLKPVISEFKNRLSVLTKFKWALKDKDNFKKLIADLKIHSESLYRLCPENAFESMNIYLTMECLAKQESPDGLKWTSRFATQQIKIDAESSVREGYELLASAATLKASINQNKGREEVEDAVSTSIDEEQHVMSYLGKGLALFEGEVVYVEMRDYRGPPLELTAEQKKTIKRRQNRALFLKSISTGGLNTRQHGRFSTNPIYECIDSEEVEEDIKPIEIVRPADPKLRALIKNFFKTFQGVNMRNSVYGLDIAGMIDHTKGEHKGYCSILYKLPGTIGVQSRERPAENLKLRAPITLESLFGIEQREGVDSTLGARFKLARKLVRAVCLLHSSGWLHKNIRAKSIIFFPEHVGTLQEHRYEMKIEIDVSNPILMGYIFSRPDDVITRMSQPSASSPPFAVPPPEETAPHERMRSYSVAWVDPLHKKETSKQRMRTPQYKSIYGRDMLETIVIPEQTEVTNISGFTLDYYQHPAKHADPNRMYRHAYDVYSLGILLLEIGLWVKLDDYEASVSDDDGNPGYDEEDHYERRRWVCERYLDDLRWACGDIYADVVLSCLMVDSTDDEVAKVSQRELCARIVADLEGCQA